MKILYYGILRIILTTSLRYLLKYLTLVNNLPRARILDDEEGDDCELEFIAELSSGSSCNCIKYIRLDTYIHSRVYVLSSI